MTSEILFQENTEIDSIQQMITTIHNHIAEYRSNLSRRPNVYRPKIAELQANLAQIYWYDYKDYHSAEKLFLQALENYEKYSGRRIIIQSHKLKIMDFLVNLYPSSSSRYFRPSFSSSSRRNSRSILSRSQAARW